LKIQKVEALPVSLPVGPFSDAYGTYDHLNYVVVKIHTDEGLTGIGEASPIDPSFYGETQESIVATVEKHVSPIVLGKDPFNIEWLESSIDQRIAGNTCAKAAIDMALYDLVGKAQKVPVYILLGGLFRENAAVALELGITRPEDMTAKIARLLDTGAKVIKLHVGTTPKKDIEAIRVLYDAVGGSAVIRADANCAYTTPEAVDVIKNVENCELEYFEQPVSKRNLDGLTKIRHLTQTPIAVDESVWTPEDAMEICKRNAADVINIKISRVGGLNKAKKIANISEACFMKSHVGCEFELGVGTAAKIHLAVSLSNATCLAAGEFTEIAQLRDNIVKDPVVMTDGFMKPCNEPGLGIELDEQKMRLYARKLQT
jgi:o-succinylbenzoate synthase